MMHGAADPQEPKLLRTPVVGDRVLYTTPGGKAREAVIVALEEWDQVPADHLMRFIATLHVHGPRGPYVVDNACFTNMPAGSPAAAYLCHLLPKGPEHGRHASDHPAV